MQHSAKYLIHAEIRTSGVVERSDVVGAVFGQTEGLLGEDLDLRTLQDSEKVGRIDVDLESTDGHSVGRFTVASGMDRVETAVLAASFETIDRVGPCRAECTVTEIEDVRAAKRRHVVDRAAQLLQEFEETAITGETLVEEVRKRARAGEITEYAGLPAGSRVESSDAVIIVEGRADVRQLLAYGIKNAIAVEGTDVPDAVVQLTQERTTTAFLDGDRGGDLILAELEQVGDIDYVAFAPDGQSVEDLTREEVTDALERKLPYEQVTDGTTPREAFGPTEGGTVAPAESADDRLEASDSTGSPREAGQQAAATAPTAGESAAETPDAGTDGGIEAEMATDTPEAASPGVDAETDGLTDSAGDGPADSDAPTATDTTVAETDEPAAGEREPQTLAGHVEAVVAGDTGQVRLLDEELTVLDEAEATAAFDLLAETEPPPHSVVIDGALTQQLLDVAAQRGVGQIIAAETHEFVKQPTSVRIRTADEIL